MAGRGLGCFLQNNAITSWKFWSVLCIMVYLKAQKHLSKPYAGHLTGPLLDPAFRDHSALFLIIILTVHYYVFNFTMQKDCTENIFKQLRHNWPKCPLIQYSL